MPKPAKKLRARRKRREAEQIFCWHHHGIFAAQTTRGTKSRHSTLISPRPKKRVLNVLIPAEPRSLFRFLPPFKAAPQALLLILSCPSVASSLRQSVMIDESLPFESAQFPAPNSGTSRPENPFLGSLLIRALSSSLWSYSDQACHVRAYPARLSSSSPPNNARKRPFIAAARLW